MMAWIDDEPQKLEGMAMFVKKEQPTPERWNPRAWVSSVNSIEHPGFTYNLYEQVRMDNKLFYDIDITYMGELDVRLVRFNSVEAAVEGAGRFLQNRKENSANNSQTS